MDIKEEQVLGERIRDHWYYVAKGRAMRDFLAGRSAPTVVDVGAGSGIFSKQLLERGVCERAICVDPGYEREWTTQHAGREIAFVRDLGEVPANLILMMDVLEHVDDDVALLRQYAGRMATGGVVFVTVPAFQFLWSGHDVFLEHRRRYTIGQLRSSLSRAGLRVVRDRYFFATLFPLICGMRWFAKVRMAVADLPAKSDLRIHPPLENAILTALHDVERRTLFRVNRLAGLSIFALAEKE